MMEEVRELSEEAKAVGLAVVVWSYPRGGSLSKEAETAVDIIAYGAHMAALMGAHIIKVKPPTGNIGLDAAKKSYEKVQLPDLKSRVAHVVQSCFNGRRMVVFSGMETTTDLEGFYRDIRSLRDGGATGSIIGRNSFQRPREEAMKMLDTVINIYSGKA